MNHRPPPYPLHTPVYQIRSRFQQITPAFTPKPATHPNSIHIRVPAFQTNSNRFDSLQDEEVDHPPGFSKPIFKATTASRRFDITEPVEARKYFGKRVQAETAKVGGGKEGSTKPKRMIVNTEKVDGDNKTTICIMNVSKEVKDGEIVKCCSIYGGVDKAKRCESRRREDLVYYLVKFNSNSDADRAVKRLGGTRRFFKSWKVAWAREEMEDNSKKEDGEFKRNIICVEGIEVCNLLGNSWLVVMEKHRKMDEIEEILSRMGCATRGLIRWGHYGVIAVCKGEGEMKIWQNNLMELEKAFVKVEKVDINRGIRSRFCWIQCEGIPIQAWSLESMENVAARWGKLLAIDKETDMVRRLDIAKLFIEVRDIGHIDTVIEVEFKEENYNLSVKEIDREDEVEFLLPYMSKLGRRPNGGDNLSENQHNQVEKVWSLDIDREDSREDFGCTSQRDDGQFVKQTGLEGNMGKKDGYDLVENASSNGTGSTSKEGRNVESDIWENTFVAESNTHVNRVESTPNFAHKEVNNIKDKEICGIAQSRKRGKSVGKVGEDANCECCKKYNRKGDQLQGVIKSKEVDFESFSSESRESKETSDTRPETSKRGGGRKDKRKKWINTPLLFGARGILGRRIGKPSKSRKKNSKNKQKKEVEREVLMEQQASEDRVREAKKNFVETGISICAEIGVKGIRSSARKLNFSEFIQNDTWVQMDEEVSRSKKKEVRQE